MDVISFLRKVVAALAGVAILLLAPPATAVPGAHDSGMVAGTSSAYAATHDCCDERVPADQGHGGGDCRPGMACHASPTAVPPPTDAAIYVPMARVAYLPSPAHRLESRPSDDLLRPPKA